MSGNKIKQFETIDVPREAADIMLKRSKPLFWYLMHKMEIGQKITLDTVIMSVYLQGLSDGVDALQHRIDNKENIGGDGI